MKQHLTLIALTAALTAAVASAQEKPSPEHLRAVIRELRAKAGELKAAGKLDEARRVWNEAEGLMKRAADLDGGPGKKPGRKPEAVAAPTGKGDDARKKHLAEAIAHLREAGMADLAEKLQHHLATQSKTEDPHHKPQGDQPKVKKEGAAPGSDLKPQKPQKSSGDAYPSKPSGNEEVRGLRAELDELRKAMRELQQHLNRDRGPRKE